MRVPNRLRDISAKSLGKLPLVLNKANLHRPVFFIGCGRSGTTALARYLSKHPELAVYPTEANDLWHPNLYPWTHATLEVEPYWKNPRSFTIASLSQPNRQFHDRYLRKVFCAFQFIARKPCFVNKSVMVTFAIDHILELFPDARFIHVLRDGRASALSFARKEHAKINESTTYQEKGIQPSFDELLQDFAKFWADNVNEVSSRQQFLEEESNRFIELRYESLCSDSTAITEELCRFLGVSTEWNSARVGFEFKNFNHKFSQDLTNVQQRLMNELIGEELEARGYSVS